MFNHLSSSLASLSHFGDLRLSRRFGLIISQLGNNFGLSLPQCAGSHGQTQAVYRFMNNSAISDRQIIEAESKRVVEQLVGASAGRTYLALSDTTTLNYSRAKGRAHLDCLNSTEQKGLFLQSLLLADAEGCPEGLLRQSFFARSAQTLGSGRAKANSVVSKKAPLEDKESNRWVQDLECLQRLFGQLPQHRFIHICDREGDMFELFAARRFEHIHVLTRLNYDRCTADASIKVKQAVRSADLGGDLVLTFRDDKIKAQRTARLEVRWAQVLLAVPPMLKRHHTAKGYRPIPMCVVEAFEPSPQVANVEPLHWVLLTTLKVETLPEALQLIRFYSHRWRIEDFHLVLKEGCAVEKLQLETPHALKNTIATWSLIAVQVLRLRYLGQTQGGQPMQVIGLPTNA